MYLLRDLEEASLASGDSFDLESRGKLGRLANYLCRRGVPRQETVHAFFVPGRIEVLGKHTDYGGGRSLVVASEQGFWAAACSRQDRQLIIADLASDTAAEFEIGASGDSESPGWTVYPRTVVNRLVTDLDRNLKGAEVVFFSDLPAAAGMSSSSALIVATFLAVAKANCLESRSFSLADLTSRENLAGYLGAVESGRPFGSFESGEGVGTRGGNQDHTAILCSRSGELRQFSFIPTSLERTIAMPEGMTFAVAVSGVVARKTGRAKDGYNQSSRLARQLVEIWNRHTGRRDASLADVLSATAAAGKLEEILNKHPDHESSRSALVARLRHFAFENGEVVPGAAGALERHDLDEFGCWVDRSQEAADRWLGNQVEETSWLAAEARELGAVAASAFGAGFGGSVWAMVKQEHAGDFLELWSTRYTTRFPGHAAESRFFSTGAGGPATEL